MKFMHCLAPALAIAAVAQGQAAQAQSQACIAPADLGDTIIYAVPIAYDAARTACAARLRSDGFLARGGEQFVSGFRARQNAAWPGAFRAMQVMLAQQDGNGRANDLDIAALAASLPEANLRPFVDGMMGQMIAGEIKPDSCNKIERAMQLLSPLPVDNVAGLVGFMMELTDLREPVICPPSPARKKG